MCYKISRRNGALIVAVIQFTTALLTLIWLCTGHPEIDLQDGLILTALIFTVINFFMPFVLFYGVIGKRTLFVQITLIWEGICLIFFMVFLAIVALHQFEWMVGQEIFILNGGLFFIHCAFLYVVYNYYEGVQLQKYECQGQTPAYTNFPTPKGPSQGSVRHTEI